MGSLRLPEGVGERERGLFEGTRERRGLGNAPVVVVVGDVEREVHETVSKLEEKKTSTKYFLCVYTVTLITLQSLIILCLQGCS